MPRDRKGRFTVTARRITERERITEEVTADMADTAEIIWAPGPRTPVHPTERWNAQRRQQVWRAAEIVVAAADPSTEYAPLRPLDEQTLRQVVGILRALPGATPLELTLGRST